MPAVIVVEQDAAGWLDIAAQHVPDAGHQIFARIQERRVRHPAGGHDHHVRRQRQHVLGLGVAVEAEIDPEQLDLAREPARDPGDLLAPGRLGGQVDLAAEAIGGLEQDHLVAAQAGHPGRLHAAHAAADHHHPAHGPFARRDDVGHYRFRPVAALWMQSASLP